MKIDFVRHGQTEDNKNDLLAGISDKPLNEEGEREAKKTLKNISHDYSFIYSSNLKRCKQTADILNVKMQLPIKYDTRLRERFFGSLEGTKGSEIDPLIWKKDHDQQYDYHPFGGESIEDVKKRVFNFIKDLMQEKKEGKILVVTHGGIIRMLHHVLKGKIPETIHNASVHEFEFPENFF